MTPPTSFLFTNSPFLPSQVPLASFVPYRTQPHQDAETPYTVTEDDYEILPDEDLDCQVDINSSGRLGALLTKFIQLSFRHDKGSMLHVKAKNGNIYSLNQPERLFNKILTEGDAKEEIQQQLEAWRQRKIQPHFVVAYRTFIDATIVRGEHRSTSVEGKAGAPLSTMSGDPTGAMDVDFRTGGQSARNDRQDVTTTGERIYAICYRKVDISARSGQPHTIQYKNEWRSFLARGEAGVGADEKHYRADLTDEDDLDGFERQYVTTSQGEVLAVGVPNGVEYTVPK